MRKTFDILYYKDRRNGGKELSHKYSEQWVKIKYFCPRCGKQEVWFCADGGDYYVGAQQICTACRGTFYLPNGIHGAGTDEQDKQRLAHLTS